jgi:hypothetical protein
MFASIRHYTSSNPDEVVRRVEEGFIPIISQTLGFIAYYVVDGGGGALATVSVFDSQAGADESTRLAADWVSQNLAGLFDGPPAVTAGEVRAHR